MNINVGSVLRQWFSINENRFKAANFIVEVAHASAKDKGVISFEKRGVVIATVEAWGHGDVDFTWMRLDQANNPSSFDHMSFSREDELSKLVEQCFKRLLEE